MNKKEWKKIMNKTNKAWDKEKIEIQKEMRKDETK